jgi:hypothetical protein
MTEIYKMKCYVQVLELYVLEEINHCSYRRGTFCCNCLFFSRIAVVNGLMRASVHNYSVIFQVASAFGTTHAIRADGRHPRSAPGQVRRKVQAETPPTLPGGH